MAILFLVYRLFDAGFPALSSPNTKSRFGPTEPFPSNAGYLLYCPNSGGSFDAMAYSPCTTKSLISFIYHIKDMTANNGPEGTHYQLLCLLRSSSKL